MRIHADEMLRPRNLQKGCVVEIGDLIQYECLDILPFHELNGLKAQFICEFDKLDEMFNVGDSNGNHYKVRHV